MAEPQTGRIGGGVLKDNLLRQGVNLNFKNTSGSTALLHLDVNNAKIGINTETATDALTVPTTLATTNLISTYANIGPNITIDQSQIVALGGDGFINFNATNNIFATAIATDDLKIDFNTISTTTPNTNIELRPDGSGTVNINSNWNITGNLHATGDIQTVGNLTLGNDDDDDVTFISDINSDIIPDETNPHDLGSPSKQWLNLYSESLFGQIANLDAVNLAGVSPSRRQGNIFYVSTLGNDTNVGDHPQGSFRTLKHALAQADGSTSGPTAIHVFPGVYEEEFPLTVPSHVDIVGEDIRNVVIKPTVATQNNSAFYLEDDVTIENLTIKDFYDGYAFQFTAGGLVSTRSPYIRNVTVITKGSATSASDPRGFDQGDAGKGALIDGAALDSASLEASMLFHSCTFITPGVDAITMTNGVRVEWLNSFTYFANRGLYATQGASGKLMPDASIRYGAEIRSIGSASVYGNYGAVADGANTLMYLIGHNFAYIGTGKDTSNDNTLAIPSQSVTELNSGTIVHTSTDQTGKFNVGDAFFVDFETGETSIDANEVDFSGISAININNGVDQTYIDGERVDTGNIRFTGNNVETLTGPLDIESATNNINFLKSTTVDGNIEMSGNFTISGELINVGNEITDTVAFNTEFIRDVVPDISGRYNLGSANKIWSKSWLSQAQIADITIKDNFITTTESNADLELRASGTGNIYVPNNDVQIDNNLTTNGNTDLQDTSITGTLTLSGDVNHQGDRTVTGNASITENLDITRAAQFEEILIDDNIVTTTSSDADLEFRASGTGSVIVPGNDVVIENNLTANDIDTNNINVQNNITSVELSASNNIFIRDNFIETTSVNSDLIFGASGTGKVITSNPVDISSNINVLNNMTFTGNLIGDDILSVTDISAAKTFNAEIFNISGQILIEDNYITTTESNSDLDLRAAGTGSTFLNNVFANTNTLGTTEDDLQFTIAGDLNITSTASLQLPTGTTNQRVITPDTFLDGGTATITGATLDGGIATTVFSSNDTIYNSGFARLSSAGVLGDIRFNTTDNVFEGTSDGTVTFGGVYSSDRNTSLVAHPTNDTIIITANNITHTVINSTGLETAAGVQVDDIFINNNVITTNVSNSDLELQSSITNRLDIDDLSIIGNSINNLSVDSSNIIFKETGFGKSKFAGASGVVVPLGTTLEQPMYSDRIEITNIISIGTTTVIETSTAHGLNAGDEIYVSEVESSTDDNLENLNTDDSSSPGSHGVVSAPTTTRLEIAVDTTGANIGNYVIGTGYLVARQISKEPPVGDTRWNTDSVVLETWDGEQYVVSAGTAEAIGEAEFEELLLQYTLTFE